jgi:hypothetical protein
MPPTNDVRGGNGIEKAWASALSFWMKDDAVLFPRWEIGRNMKRTTSTRSFSLGSSGVGGALAKIEGLASARMGGAEAGRK